MSMIILIGAHAFSSTRHWSFGYVEHIYSKINPKTRQWNSSDVAR